MATYTTTAKHLRKFARFVMKWRKKMGLERWAIFIGHKDDEEDPDGDAAWVVSHYETLVATINLSKTWPVPPTDSSLEMSAFHECRHLFYAPVMDLVPSGLDEIARMEEHRLIVLDERMQFGKALSEIGADDDGGKD